jgi:hypothetical protein
VISGVILARNEVANIVECIRSPRAHVGDDAKDNALAPKQSN